MARVYPFNNGVLMLRNISAPFLNALEDNPRWTLRGCCPENCLPFTGGRNGFCHFHSFHVHEKNRAFLNLLAKKKAPRNWTQQHCANCSCQSVRFCLHFWFLLFFQFPFFWRCFCLVSQNQKIQKKQSKQNTKQEQKENKRCKSKTNEILWFKTKQDNKQNNRNQITT